MHLLRSRELTFVDVEGKVHAPYVILSHVWYKNGQEVTYEEMKSGAGREKSGYDKIVQCGKLAVEMGYQFFWIDTCCIDKRSSAELSEAINSMFAWYRDADVCYAYLSDVPAATFQAPYTEFTESRWFERGWTLQELLAPSNVLFLSKEWTSLGSKEGLSDLINQRTKINKAALTNKEPLSWFSVAERMSWAAFRQTTRIEDRAYSLMGLFGVHMSLLYGEKEKAFIRLQQKVMKTTADQSLFAWKDSLLTAEEYCGLLARSPDCFVDSACYRFSELYAQSWESRTAKGGLMVSFYVVPYKRKKHLYYANLDCIVAENEMQSPALILKKLKRFDVMGGSGEYARVHANEIRILTGAEKSSGQRSDMLVRQDIAVLMSQIQSQNKLLRFHIKDTLNKELAVFPAEQWNPQNRLLSIRASSGKLGAIAFEVEIGTFLEKKRKVLLSIFGIDEARKAWIHVIEVPQEVPEEVPEEVLENYWLSYVPSGVEQSEVMIEFPAYNESRRARIWASSTHGALLWVVDI